MWFGSVKGIKQLIRLICFEPGTGIFDRYIDKVIIAVRSDRKRPRSTLLHSIDRVAQEVQSHLLNLQFVGLDLGQVFPRLTYYVNLLHAHIVLQHLKHIVNEIIDRDVLPLHTPLANKLT